MSEITYYDCRSLGEMPITFPEMLAVAPRGYGISNQHSIDTVASEVHDVVARYGSDAIVFYPIKREGADAEALQKLSATVYPFTRGSEWTMDVVTTLFIQIRAEDGSLEKYGVFSKEQYQPVLLRKKLDIKQDVVSQTPKEKLHIRSKKDIGIPLNPVEEAIELIGTRILKEGVQNKKNDGSVEVILGGHRFPIVYRRGEEIRCPFQDNPVTVDPDVVVPVHATLDLTSAYIDSSKELGQGSLIQSIASQIFEHDTVLARVVENRFQTDLIGKDLVGKTAAMRTFLNYRCRDGDKKVLDAALENARVALPDRSFWGPPGDIVRRVRELWARVSITNDKGLKVFAPMGSSQSESESSEDEELSSLRN